MNRDQQHFDLDDDSRVRASVVGFESLTPGDYSKRRRTRKVGESVI